MASVNSGMNYDELNAAAKYRTLMFKVSTMFQNSEYSHKVISCLNLW